MNNSFAVHRGAASAHAQRLRVALLDDHAVVRYGLAACLAVELDIEAAGIYSNTRELMAGLLAAPADILLLDYTLGPDEPDCASLIRALRTKFPDTAVVVLSAHQEPATVALVLGVGARGFIGKAEEMTELVKALRLVASGGVYLSMEMSYLLAEAICPVPAEGSRSDDWVVLGGAVLSSHEHELINCYLAGMAVGDIAKKFKRSITTIGAQYARALRKLDVPSGSDCPVSHGIAHGFSD